MSAPQLKQINTLIDAALGKSPKAARQYASRNPTPAPPPLETVDAIRARVMTQKQLQAMAELQDGLLMLAKLERGINELVTKSGVNIPAITLTQIGDTWHRVEGLLFEHNCAAAKLRNGGLPLAAPVAKQRAA